MIFTDIRLRFSVQLPITNSQNCHLLCAALSSSVVAWGIWACSIQFHWLRFSSLLAIRSSGSHPGDENLPAIAVAFCIDSCINTRWLKMSSEFYHIENIIFFLIRTEADAPSEYPGGQLVQFPFLFLLRDSFFCGAFTI